MPPPLVICFLRNRGELLLVRQSGEGDSSQLWAGITAPLEGDDPAETGRTAIAEETTVTDAAFIRAGPALRVSLPDRNRPSQVHPVLFDAPDRTRVSTAGFIDAEWVHAPAMVQRETIQGLWELYRRVGPTPERIAMDTDRGSAAISISALECLRDSAAIATEDGSGLQPVRETARALREARPSMAALTNRLNRVMASTDSSPEIERAAKAEIADAFDADSTAARVASERIADQRVLTLSKSGTVTEALVDSVDSVTVAESRPGCEGVDTAETLHETDLSMTLCTDAAIGHVLSEHEIDAVLVGADTVLPDGRVVNKTGTRLTALSAANEDIPCFAVCASDKITYHPTPTLESGSPSALYSGAAELSVLNPRFDITPADAITVISEQGILSTTDISDIAKTHRELADWDSS